MIRQAKLPTATRTRADFFTYFDEPVRAVVAKELANGVWYMLTRKEAYKGFKGTMTKISTENY